MPDFSKVAGVVLAGGHSSRMGKNKALLSFKGKPLVEHMMDLLKGTGLRDVLVSGNLDSYPCIHDSQKDAGPVQGIKSVLQAKPDYQGYLFVPVDMPLLSPVALRFLLAQSDGGYFSNWPLPVYLTPPFVSCDSSSVFSFLKVQGVAPISLPKAFEKNMVNANTPQEWEDVIKAS